MELLPVLRALAVLQRRLQATSLNLLEQLGALCAAHTRKDTILQGALAASRCMSAGAGCQSRVVPVSVFVLRKHVAAAGCSLWWRLQLQYVHRGWWPRQIWLTHQGL